MPNKNISYTYDHRHRRNGHPVRSAIHKPVIGRLVVGSVTTSESLLLYVFDFLIRSDPYGKVDEEFLVTRWSTHNIISRSIEAKEQGFAELDVGRVITYLDWHHKDRMGG